MPKLDLTQPMKQPNGETMRGPPKGKDLEGDPVTLGSTLVSALVNLQNSSDNIRLFRVTTELSEQAEKKNEEWDCDIDKLTFIEKEFKNTAAPPFIKGQVLSVLDDARRRESSS